MTDLERQIQNWILRAIDAYEQGAQGASMPDFALRQAIRSAHPGVAFTEEALTGHIAFSDTNKFIGGVDDPVDGKVWNLLSKGKNRLNQIR